MRRAVKIRPASDESSPMMTKTAKMCLLTLMPEYLAASLFPPMAYRYRPKQVRFRTKPKIRRRNKTNRMGTGIPK